MGKVVLSYGRHSEKDEIMKEDHTMTVIVSYCIACTRLCLINGL